jgi:hypothetical protein
VTKWLPWKGASRDSVLELASGKALETRRERSDDGVIYQHPLAYLLGLEGVALLRGFSGVYDRVVARPGRSRHECALAGKAGRDHLALPAY